MVINKALLLIFVTFASVGAQTFQYSRGWTNGKRDGHRREDITSHRREEVRDTARDAATRLEKMEIEKIVSPCQMNKLKYILEGKPIVDELLFIPCDTMNDDGDAPNPRYKVSRTNQEPLFDVFQ